MKRPRRRPAGGDEALASRPARGRGDQRPRERGGVPRRHHQAVLARREELAQHGQVARHHRQAGRLGLEDHEPEALALGGEGQGVRGPVEGGHVRVGHRPQHGDVGGCGRGRAPVHAQAQALGVGLPGRPVVGVVEQRLAAGDREQRPRPQVAAGAVEGLEQGPAALARLDAADRQDRRPPTPPQARAGLRPAEGAGGEAGGVDAVRDDVGAGAVVALEDRGPVAADADAVVHVLDRGPLALAQHRAREVVDVVDRPHHRRDAPLGAQRQQRARRQAVLGVVDVGGAGPPQAVGQHPGVAQDPRLDLLAGPPLDRHEPGGDPRRAEEAGPVGRQGPQLHLVAPVAQRLGEREGVNHAAARLGRVGDQADPHPARAAARRAAAALLGARRAPASASAASWRLRTWGSPSVPST